jgi:hypothetical protein
LVLEVQQVQQVVQEPLGELVVIPFFRPLLAMVAVAVEWLLMELLVHRVLLAVLVVAVGLL